MAFTEGDKVVAVHQIGEEEYTIAEDTKGVIKYVYKRTDGSLVSTYPYDVLFENRPTEVYPVTIDEIKAAPTE